MKVAEYTPSSLLSLGAQAASELRHDRGVTTNFELHLKECDWRWGKDADTLLRELRTLLV